MSCCAVGFIAWSPLQKYNFFISRCQSATTSTVSFAEKDQLQLVVSGKHTCACNSPKDVGTRTFEERLGTLLGHYLVEGIQAALVLHCLSWCHHHAPPHCIQWVWRQACHDGDAPSQHEARQKISLQARHTHPSPSAWVSTTFFFNRASPEVLSMGVCTLKLDEEKSKHCGLPQENGFGLEYLRLVNGTAKLCTCQRRVK